MTSATDRVLILPLPVAPRRDGIIDLDALVERLGPVDLLESADRSGWSYVIPHALNRGLLRDDGHGAVLQHADGRREDLGTDPLAALDVVAARLGLSPHGTGACDSPVPFTGGLVGALAYELGTRLQPGLARGGPAEVPDLLLRLTGVLVAVPRERDRALLIIDPTIPGTVCDEARAWVQRRCEQPTGSIGADDGQHPAAVAPSRVDRSMPRSVLGTSLEHDAHVAAIERIQAAIAAGETYQVNLAQRLEGQWDDGLWALYRRLRASSPASHAALLPVAGIASISPETFLRVLSGVVTTEPIKGTRPRSDDAELDAALADDLLTSAKDRAENVMIVDLERNDLGRVSRIGSVTVPTLLELRALPTVWHLVSTVRAELRPEVTYGQLLAATFPSGSVTGAPRLAAMRIIASQEPTARGWYCGAIGFLGRHSAALSVAIRTATLSEHGRVTFGAGGGIVADSAPHDEVIETLDKALPFLRALGVTRVAAGAPVHPGERRPADRAIDAPSAAADLPRHRGR
jgi:para-aminobenzoate synthetase component I